jgi:hypothetical protein
MLTMAIWLAGISLEGLLLFRGRQVRLLRRFPIFYFYILFVLADEILRFSVYRWYPKHYAQVYWSTQFLGLFIGSAVIFEIYRVGLVRFPGTARMTRYVLLFVFGVVVTKALTNQPDGLLSWLAGTSVELERDLRTVQALAILTLVSLFFWYAIPFGRNLKGILLGYGLFIATSLVQFALWHYSIGNVEAFWPYAQPLAYILVLAVWMGALWSADPVPQIELPVQLEKDYQILAASTRNQLQRALAFLGWAVRP